MAIDEIKTNDPVNRPAHYTDGKIEVIDFIEDKKLGFHLGNAVKYISRAGKKNKDKEVEDLQKAIWYIKRRIENIQEEPKSTIVAIPVKHDAPIWCKIRVKIFGKSPSAIFGRCGFGCTKGCKGCKGCKYNVREMIHDSFILGLKRGGVRVD